jgi:flagellin
MTSILTNIAAQSALATLRTINSQMQTTQEAVASGLRVGSAENNAAYWSIATTMRSDNGAISAVEDALGLGAAKVDVAYAGMEAAIDVVKEIKKKLVTATEGAVDKGKIQDEISQFQDQLRSIAEGANFAGESLLKADMTGIAADSDAYDSYPLTDKKTVVSSFVRDSNGNVSVKTVDFLTSSRDVLLASNTSGLSWGILDMGVIFDGIEPRSGQESTGNLETYHYSSSWQLNEHGVYSDGTDFYTRLNGLFVKATDAGGNIDYDNTTSDFAHLTNLSIMTIDVTALDLYSGVVLGADADPEWMMDVLLYHVDRQLNVMTETASKFGSLSKRIELQSDFAAKLSDAIDSGIGRLVDADMNEQSTRLKALQTQQQLGIQALSIANSQPENVTQLFR